MGEIRSRLALSDAERSAGRPDAATVRRGAELFREHGFLLVPDLLDRARVDALRAAYLALVAPLAGTAAGQEVGDFRFMLTVPIAGLFNDPDVYANPFLLPIVRDVLGDDCVVANFGSVVSLPWAERQHEHRDGPFLFDKATGAGLPCHALTLALPLVDLDAEIGTTAVWEGSHKLQSDDPALAGPASHPFCTTGGAYLFDYRLLHYGTPNTSERKRPLLYMAYSRPWFVDHRNFSTRYPPLVMPAAEHARVPDGHKRLFLRVAPVPGAP